MAPAKAKTSARKPPAPAGRARRLLTGWPAAAVVLAGFYVLMLSSVAGKSVTFDEIVHVTAGYAYWRFDDFRLNPENGNLPQRVGAFGPWTMGARFPDISGPGRDAWTAAGAYRLGGAFFYEVGNDVPRMLLAARACMGLLAVALGAAVYGWGRRLFGPAGGMLSLMLYALNPAVLANGPLVTSDMAAALFFVLALWAAWEMLSRLTAWTVLAGGLAMGGLFVSKFSAPLAVPMALTLAAVRLAVGRPLPVRWAGKSFDLVGRGRQAAALALAVLANAAIVVVVIWTFYGFRYRMTADAAGRYEPALGWDTLSEQSPPAIAAATRFLREHRLLPEAYLYGASHVLAYSRGRAAFLNGQVGNSGWRSFFPYTFAVKTPLALLAVLALALAAAAAKWRAARREAGVRIVRSAAKALYATAPLWVLLIVYWAVSIASHLNIGHRHILPTYPALFILAGAAAWWLRPRPVAGRRLIDWARARPIGASLAALLAVLAVETAWTWPNYLAYFNGVVRPRHAWRHLVDSSLDWGQDLPALKTYVDDYRRRNPDARVYVSYFGNGSPAYYGLEATLLPGFCAVCPPNAPVLTPTWPADQAPRQAAEFERRHGEYFLLKTEPASAGRVTYCYAKRPERLRLTGGLYCISASMIHPLYRRHVHGPWTEQFERVWTDLLPLTRRLQGPSDPDRPAAAFPDNDAHALELLMNQCDELRFARLCEFLRRREPTDLINRSILVYELTDADIERMLEGPLPNAGLCREDP